MAPRKRSHLGSRNQPELSRHTILQAAIQEFAAHGLEGARIDSIAQSARVNKALLYYYFRDKEGLYGAALDHTFGKLVETLDQVLDLDLAPAEKVLAYAGAHFDYVASNPIYQRLLQHELMRTGARNSLHFERIVSRHLRPVFGKLAVVLAKGTKLGVFRQVSPEQFMLSMVGVVVFYFSSMPITRAFSDLDLLAPTALRERRAAVLDFISAGLFRDPALADHVLGLPHITKADIPAADAQSASL
ncbi:MAG TPA: TetR family transcriptional regulator [Clostridia bacterium]|nr:TetR family transcriptional regulator [Clostridia bacterium]